MNESVELAKYFAQNLNIKFTSKVFTKQIAGAKNLLSTYTFDECKSVIDYIARYGYKRPITSIFFMQYIMNDILTEIQKKEVKKELNKNVIINVEQNSANITDNINKLKENNFAKRGMITF